MPFDGNHYSVNLPWIYYQMNTIYQKVTCIHCMKNTEHLKQYDEIIRTQDKEEEGSTESVDPCDIPGIDYIPCKEGIHTGGKKY